MSIEALVRQVLIGLSSGMVMFLVACGLSLIFGSMRIINLAHGSFYMLGAYLLATVTTRFQSSLLSFFLTLLLVPVVIALVGGLIERLLIRRIYFQPAVYQISLTWGICLVIGDAVKMMWGPFIKNASPPDSLYSSIPLLGEAFPVYYLFLIGFSAALALTIWLMMEKTKLGVLIRSVVSDRGMASLLGINVDRVSTGTFMFGVWLAALGGTLVAPMVGIGPGMDVSILINCFVIIVVGGIGSLRGALVGALLLGLVNAVGTLIVPQVYMVFPFALMAIAIIVRTSGVFGGAEA